MMSLKFNFHNIVLFSLGLCWMECNTVDTGRRRYNEKRLCTLRNFQLSQNEKFKIGYKHLITDKR